MNNTLYNTDLREKRVYNNILKIYALFCLIIIIIFVVEPIKETLTLQVII